MSGIASAASTIPGSVATFSSCSSEPSSASLATSSGSAKTRAGTRMSGLVAAGISHSVSSRRTSSDVEDDAPMPDPSFVPEFEVTESDRLHELTRPTATADDRRAQAAALKLERREPPRHEPLHLGEEDELVQPVGEQESAIVGLKLDLALDEVAVAALLLGHELGERLERRCEDSRLVRGLDLDLDLAAVLREPVHPLSVPSRRGSGRRRRSSARRWSASLAPGGEVGVRTLHEAALATARRGGRRRPDRHGALVPEG